ncbi:MAG: SH3 domain-containing protein [Marinicellaceae bacterium]
MIWFVSLVLVTPNARADLLFNLIDLDIGRKAILVEGKFSFDDNLAPFEEMLNSPDVQFVSFNSVGGNVAKAMELGRAIRRAQKDTVQVRKNNCESACALAFYGGVRRIAEAGSIGVHRSSLPEEMDIPAHGAVEAVQIHIAVTTTYLIEMDIDPSLLELTLQYSSDDIRYLSSSEMLKYSITTSYENAVDNSTARKPKQKNEERIIEKPTPTKNYNILGIPKATHALVRNAKGSVPLKSSANRNSANIATVKNGSDVKILSDKRPWFKVWHNGKTGYMHVTWLWIQNYQATEYNYSRFIQIKSFDNLSDAEQFVQTTSLPVEAYLASNNWFSIVLDGKYSLDDAQNMVKALKEQKIVPNDSFITLGNTYVRKVCCD